MRKLRVFFITCAAVFVVGVAMSIGGAAAGGVQGFEKVAEDRDWVTTGPGAQATVELQDLDFDAIEATGVMDVVIVGESSYSEVVRDYNLEGAAEPKAGTAVCVFGSNVEPPDVKLDGKTLKLTGGAEQEFQGINLNFSSASVYPAVIVFCPDKEIDSIKVSSAFSDVTLKDISVKQADIQLNYGDVETENIVSQGIMIDNEFGDAALSGDLKGTTEIQLEEGDIELDTKTDPKAYSMKIKTEAGDITIGDKESGESKADEEGYSYTQTGGEDTLLLETINGDVKVRQISQ